MKKNPPHLLLLTGCILGLTAFSKDDPGKQRVSFANGISIANTAIVEGNSGQRTIEVTIVLSPPAAGPVTVDYSTKNGTATAGADYVAASGSVRFEKGERVKKIKITVIGDLNCEPDKTFEIVLSNPSGATLVKNTGKVTIINDDCLAGNPGFSCYEVRLTFTGYTTFFIGPPDCPVRPSGRVVLTGVLCGAENVSSDDDIMYRGTLQLDIDIDICSVMRAAGEDKFCGMTVIGAGSVKTELEVYEGQRGGYIKINNESGDYLGLAFGSCDQEQIDEEQTMVPNKTIASVFNGLELPMLTERTLRVGKYSHAGENGVLDVEVLRKIR